MAILGEWLYLPKKKQHRYTMAKSRKCSLVTPKTQYSFYALCNFKYGPKEFSLGLRSSWQLRPDGSKHRFTYCNIPGSFLARSLSTTLELSIVSQTKLLAETVHDEANGY